MEASHLLAVMLVRPRPTVLGDTDVAGVGLRRRWPAQRRRRAPPRPAAVTVDAGDLVASSIDVQFGGFVAVYEVSASSIATGGSSSRSGPNGAGKTTLFNAVTGLVPERPGASGSATRPQPGDAPHRPGRAGPHVPEPAAVPTLSVREHVELAAMVAERHRHSDGGSGARALLAAWGWRTSRERAGSELDYGTARRLELARAAALAPAFLLLDEPTTGMNEAESAAMVDHVRRTADVVDGGVLVIDHDLHFITKVCDRITSWIRAA